jgi:AcrR family transcriptional regulator
MSTQTREFDEVFQEAEPGRKGQILESAMDVFDEYGYDGGSMREIASRVGVRESALYRHFPGKEAILKTLIRVVGTRARDEALLLLGSLKGDDIHAEVLSVIRNRRQAVRIYGPLLRLMLPVAARNPELLVDFRRDILGPASVKILAKVAELDVALGVPDADATRDVRMRGMVSLLIGYLASSLFLGDEKDEPMADIAIRIMHWDAAE